ncbi:hypothetical protein CSC2_35190 [Clostridium zeae]|uniref:DUF3990 domain-containing protein n=1 Tax=Clostridium zeae TaxID=2759022 RepID=A0ABQ1EDU4_9CLOT|nr:DUF3990 domain-containing protein [Clostridium zeae]GFZ32993.1 hypothetical protein CSC2_35190 [Clostridium zeae]
MYLYHGSNVEIRKINYKECRKTADFGRGFYTTNIKEQAIIWAKRKAIEQMGAKYNPDIKAVVTIFDFDTSVFKDPKVKCKNFHGPSIPWILFTKNNLQRNYNLKGNHNLNLQYDLVSGYVGSPELFRELSNYENGLIDRSTFTASLKATEKTNQYSFHSSLSAKYLKSPVYEYFEVTKGEFDNFHNARNCVELSFFVYDEKNQLSERKILINLANILQPIN